MVRKIEQVLKFASAYKAAQDITLQLEPIVTSIETHCNNINNLISPDDASARRFVNILLLETDNIVNELKGIYANMGIQGQNINQILYKMDKIVNDFSNHIHGHERETAIKFELEYIDYSIKSLDSFVQDLISNRPKNKMLVRAQKYEDLYNPNNLGDELFELKKQCLKELIDLDNHKKYMETYIYRLMDELIPAYKKENPSNKLIIEDSEFAIAKIKNVVNVFKNDIDKIDKSISLLGKF